MHNLEANMTDKNSVATRPTGSGNKTRLQPLAPLKHGAFSIETRGHLVCGQNACPHLAGPDGCEHRADGEPCRVIEEVMLGYLQEHDAGEAAPEEQAGLRRAATREAMIEALNGYLARVGMIRATKGGMDVQPCIKTLLYLHALQDRFEAARREARRRQREAGAGGIDVLIGELVNDTTEGDER